jgi:hypothetical protein
MKQPDVPENKSLLFSILAIPAVLGYSDVVITNRPEIKVKKSATFLSFYSIILIVLAVASSHVYIMKYVAAVFAIAAHELLVLYWIRKEKYGSPYFSVPEKGIRVLDVVKDGPADKMRILPGDIILRVNNEDVMTYQEITTLLRDYPNYIWLEILRDNKKTVTLEYQSYRERVNDLQLLYVPRDGHAANVIHITEIISPIQRIFRK